MSDRAIGELTEDIYDAAVGVTPWSTVGRKLLRLVEGETIWLATTDPAGATALLSHSDFPQDAIGAYQDHYRTVDLWTRRAAGAALGNARPVVFRSGILVPDDEFVRSEFYNDFGRALGLRYVVGTVMRLPDGGAMPLGLHRPEGAGPFEREQAERLQRVLPHLRRAMGLRARLTAPPQEAPARAALDGLATALVVVDADLAVILANEAADALALAGGAFALVRPAGRAQGRRTMRALHQADDAILRRAVRASALGMAAGGSVPLHDVSGGVITAALVSRLPRTFVSETGTRGGPGRALVLLLDLRRRGTSAPTAMIRDLFKLTAAEAEVALALAGGGTKERVAALRGAQISTVKTQVRSILAKTGTANLRDLERLMALLATA